MKCRAYELEVGDVVELYHKRHYIKFITDTHFIFWYYDNTASGKSIEIGKNSKEWVRLLSKGYAPQQPHQEPIPVIQCDKNGNEIARYNSIKEASMYSGLHQTCISDASSGKSKTSGGYIWKRLIDEK